MIIDIISLLKLNKLTINFIKKTKNIILLLNWDFICQILTNEIIFFYYSFLFILKRSLKINMSI